MPRFDESPTADAWVQVCVPGRDAQSTQVEFRFNPEYVRSIWQPASQRGTRSGLAAPEPETLLLDDVLRVDMDLKMQVTAWLIPSKESPDIYNMRVEIIAAGGVKRDMNVTLLWQRAEYTAFLKAGTVKFQDITQPDFSQQFNNYPSRDFCLMFEYVNAARN